MKRNWGIFLLTYIGLVFVGLLALEIWYLATPFSQARVLALDRPVDSLVFLEGSFWEDKPGVSEHLKQGKPVLLYNTLDQGVKITLIRDRGRIRYKESTVLPYPPFEWYEWTGKAEVSGSILRIYPRHNPLLHVGLCCGFLLLWYLAVMVLIKTNWRPDLLYEFCLPKPSARP